MLFSATLDGRVNVLVKRFLTNPKTHEADSAQSPVSTMAHHVLHVDNGSHLPMLLDLTAAPGRTVVFTRTKHQAEARQAAQRIGVPAVELHGNLSQGARTRNMDDFHSGRAQTLVATDIAARGIHVDDVALVIHADPPVEHKAYLHRSSRTARAGNDGTVVTMMLDEQVRDVRDLTRKAHQADHHAGPARTPAADRARARRAVVWRWARPRGGPAGGRSGGGSRGGSGARSGGASRPARGRGRSGGRGVRAPVPGCRHDHVRPASWRLRPQRQRGQRLGPASWRLRHAAPVRRWHRDGLSTSTGGGSAASFSAGSRAGSRRSR